MKYVRNTLHWRDVEECKICVCVSCARYGWRLRACVHCSLCRYVRRTTHEDTQVRSRVACRKSCVVFGGMSRIERPGAVGPLGEPARQGSPGPWGPQGPHRRAPKPQGPEPWGPSPESPRAAEPYSLRDQSPRAPEPRYSYGLRSFVDVAELGVEGPARLRCCLLPSKSQARLENVC